MRRPMASGGMMKMPMGGGMLSRPDIGGGLLHSGRSMSPDMMQGKEMDDDEHSSSSDPDIAFVENMIPHHQEAIDMAKKVLDSGDDEQVKDWANQIIAAQETEIAEMQEWLDAQSGQ